MIKTEIAKEIITDEITMIETEDNESVESQIQSEMIHKLGTLENNSSWTF